ncbi:Fe(3+) ABC transporter substrate-binding protein [Kordiimonas sp. SCSIO 12603]|uniref:Fe(3+) ABC transporter substrate-binding protein n=1 Tax=Kordiimonas sp. SCSIO 12603 TaxID=2829596 RepID=UPI00210775B6|nr:Fe(3+) ABC transporter substrate-binding protein [Kordiimonas sp. SCSIO 12603]UTW60278.1 Fe(3+) ABC transporter substrate-binding protein [Kordiimonas sp. SCSIO 12603]
MIRQFTKTAMAAAMAVTGLFASSANADGVVNVYSARHYDTDLALYADFEKQTGVKVNLIEAASDTLIERILNEGKYSPADILITVDAGRLYRAEQKGIFAPFTSAVLEERVPAHLRHPNGQWYGLSKRARVIIYNAAKGKPEGLNTYEDLAKPEFKGQICVRSSSNIYNISLLAAMVGRVGEEKAEEWTKGVVANFRRRPQGNDTANIRAVASGECELSIVNTYYLARLLASGNEVGKQVGVIYPNQETSGTHVNISGAGVLKYAPNRENAIKFIEYLTENRAQYLFVEGNNEYPVVKGANVTDVVKQMGEFKEDTINASELGINQAAAVRIFDRAGWN